MAPGAYEPRIPYISMLAGTSAGTLPDDRLAQGELLYECHFGENQDKRRETHHLYCTTAHDRKNRSVQIHNLTAINIVATLANLIGSHLPLPS